MHTTMMPGPLQLSLQASAAVPCHLNWRIEEGYLRIASWGDQGESFTLAVWGPGDLVMPGLVPIAPLQMLALSSARVEEVQPSEEERQDFLIQQCLQTATLLRLSRIRPAEARLFSLLLWMGERFGRVSSRGVSLPLEDMNLTHRHLAEIAGLTRVTVTKAMTHFRNEGLFSREGADALLLQKGLQQLLRSNQSNG